MLYFDLSLASSALPDLKKKTESGSRTITKPESTNKTTKIDVKTEQKPDVKPDIKPAEVKRRWSSEAKDGAEVTTKVKVAKPSPPHPNSKPGEDIMGATLPAFFEF